MISITLLSIKDNIDKIKEVYSLNPDYIHVDVMDGDFVSNKVDFLELPETDIPKDIHLMVYDIKKYVDMYSKYNPEYITFHLEATDSVEEIIQYIKGTGSKVGISISPDTPVDKLIPYLNNIDLVLVMSVIPGRGGQKFISGSTFKMDELKRLREEFDYHYQIEVDGGVNNETKEYCKSADILVVGSYLTLSDNYQEKLNSMLK